MITVNVEEPEAMQIAVGEVTEVKAKITMQEKSITPKKSSQTVTADKGFDGLSAVNIDPIPDEYVIQNLQEKTIIPTKSAQDVTADEDYTGLSAVHVEPIPDEYAIQNLQEKTVTPSDSEQSITADDGYTGLSSVTVGKIAKPFIDSSKMKYFAYMFSSTYGTDLSLLENLDTSNGTDFSYMFSKRTDLTELPSLDTSNGMNFSYMFQASTIEIPPALNVEKATTLFAIFHNAQKISGKITLHAPKNTNLGSAFSYTYLLSEIDLGDTSNVTNWNGAFVGSGVNTVNELNFKSATNYVNAFASARKLQNITFSSIPIFDNNFSFQYSPLSEESLASLVNALSDNSGIAKTYTVTLGATNIAKLTEEQLAIVAAKNINLA